MQVMDNDNSALWQSEFSKLTHWWLAELPMQLSDCFEGLILVLGRFVKRFHTKTPRSAVYTVPQTVAMFGQTD